MSNHVVRTKKCNVVSRVTCDRYAILFNESRKVFAWIDGRRLGEVTSTLI